MMLGCEPVTHGLTLEIRAILMQPGQTNGLEETLGMPLGVSTPAIIWVFLWSDLTAS